MRRKQLYRSAVALTVAYALATYGVLAVLVASSVAAAVHSSDLSGTPVICHTSPENLPGSSDGDPAPKHEPPCCVVCADGSPAFGLAPVGSKPELVRQDAPLGHGAQPPRVLTSRWQSRAGEARAPPG